MAWLGFLVFLTFLVDLLFVNNAQEISPKCHHKVCLTKHSLLFVSLGLAHSLKLKRKCEDNMVAYCDEIACSETLPCTIHTKPQNDAQKNDAPVAQPASATSDGKGEDELPDAVPLVRSTFKCRH